MLFGKVLQFEPEVIRFGRRVWPVSLYRFMADAEIRGDILGGLPRQVVLSFEDSFATSNREWKWLRWKGSYRSIHSEVLAQLAEVLDRAGVTVRAVYIRRRWWSPCRFRRAMPLVFWMVWGFGILAIAGTEWQKATSEVMVRTAAQWASQQLPHIEATPTDLPPNSVDVQIAEWLRRIPETIAQISVSGSHIVLRGVISQSQLTDVEALLHQLPATVQVTSAQTQNRDDIQVEYVIGLQISN